MRRGRARAPAERRGGTGPFGSEAALSPPRTRVLSVEKAGAISSKLLLANVLNQRELTRFEGVR